MKGSASGRKLPTDMCRNLPPLHVLRERDGVRVLRPRQARSPLRWAAAVGISFALTACSVGPNYQAPEVKVTASYGELPTSRPIAGGETSVPTTQPAAVGEWWTALNDPELNQLIDRAMRGNLTLQQAQSRLRGARYQLMIAGAELYPQANVDGGYNHARGSKNVIIPAGAFGSAASPPSHSSPADVQRIDPRSRGGVPLRASNAPLRASPADAASVQAVRQAAAAVQAAALSRCRHQSAAQWPVRKVRWGRVGCLA
jgi:hypothetical protein